MRVLIAPDKFKGTLSAREAAMAVAHGWKGVRPADQLTLLPISDGGDGFGDVMSALLEARTRRVATVDAAHRPCVARWWWEAQTRTAIIESAEVIALASLPRGRFHPADLDTFGLGKVLTAAARMNPRRCLVGVGGSATNDGGFGLACALGWRFVTNRGHAIEQWPNLAACHEIVPSRQRLRLGRLTVAVDVHNPLLGPKGCTRVYGPQKGMRPEDFKLAERALQRMSSLLSQQHAPGLPETPGAGAAGGLGFGLMAFLKARPESGFSLFAREARLKRRLRSADLVITGEGCLDKQSLMGKGVGELLTLCEARGVPCIAISGKTELPRSAQDRFEETLSLSSLIGEQRALGQPKHCLSHATARKQLSLAARLLAGHSFPP